MRRKPSATPLILQAVGLTLLAVGGFACGPDDPDSGVTLDDYGVIEDTVTGTASFGAEADARVAKSYPGSNYGSSTRLEADNSPTTRSYLRFNVSGVQGTVKSAMLRLFVTNGSSNGPAVYSTSNAWTEAGITWSNAPPPSAAALDDLGSVSKGIWVGFDVTAAVTGTGTFSFALVGTSSDGADFFSREGTNKPSLVLVMESEDCTPTTCEAQGKTCGSLSDGCGGTLECGTCTSPETCGGGGVANVCGAGSSTSTPVTLVPAATTWKYLDDGSDQGTAWSANAFDDSAWKTGTAELGYGDGDESTVVSYGTNTSNKHITTYFRKAFSVSSPSSFTSLTLRLKRDDGAVVYLNGTEVLRTNMPTGTIGYRTLASSQVEEATYHEAALPPAMLVAGVNVLAIEIHQGGSGSSDISMDAELTGVSSGASSTTDSTPPTVSLTSPLDGAMVSGNITLTATASDDVGVASVQFRWDSRDLGTADTTAPYAYSWDTTTFVDGYYTLTAVATDAAGNTTISNFAVVKLANSTSTEPPPPEPEPTGDVLRVPQDYSSIQAAINAASSGDTVLVSPGTYSGPLTVSGKAVRLASLYSTTKDPSYVDSTIIQSGAPILDLSSSAGGSSVVGFTFKGGTKGVVANAQATVEDNKFIGVGSDAVSLEGVGGIIRRNTFQNSGDDAIDGDGPKDTLIEDNHISGSSDDGMEFRNFDYTGSKTYEVVIRRNTIIGSGEDGIQFIDYPATSNRVFRIERNLIRSSADVGIGLMDNGETKEDFRAASVPERIYVINNTLQGNHYGLTGGDNLIALNNIIVDCTGIGIKGTDNKSIVAYTLFYNNATNHSASNVDTATFQYASPGFTSTYQLQSGSPAVDAGIAKYVHNGETVLDLAAGSWVGAAPDLGRYEYGQ